MSSKPSSGDLKYSGLSIEEKMRQVERDTLLWEQNEELKKSNELNRQRIQEEISLNKQRIQAETILNNEKIQAENERQERNFEHELQIEDERNKHQERMRFYKLCDELHMNYDDIEKFEIWLTHLTDEQKKLYAEIIAKGNSLISNSELNSLKEERNKIIDEIKKNEVKLEKLEEKEDDYKEDDEYDDESITVTGLDRYVNGTEGELLELIKQNKNIIAAWNFILVVLNIVAIIMFIITDYKLAVLIITGLIDLLILNRNIRLKNGIKIITDAIEKHKKESTKKSRKTSSDTVEGLSSKIYKLRKKLREKDEIINKAVIRRKEELVDNEEYKKIALSYEDALEVIYSNNMNKAPNQVEFYNFRLHHYNKDVEMLLKKLNIYLQRITKEDVIKNGTVDDYNEFIDNVLFGTDK